MHRRRRDGERGFALPFVILVVTVITLLLTAAFIRAGAEQRLAESSGSTVDALGVARSGLNRYVAYYDSILVKPADGDSLRINLTGGFADVIAHKVLTPADTFGAHRYIIRSRGTVVEPTQGADPQAVRTVAQFADWVGGAIAKVAAHTALNGVNYDDDGDLVIDGNDACVAAPTITGYRGPSGSGTPDTAGTTGLPPWTIQDPWQQVAIELGIDWYGIVNGEYEYDYTSVIPGDTTFATYFLTGNVNLTNVTGTGLLIVTGELEFRNTYNEWDGIILVGKNLHPNADTTMIRGLLVTGLNQQLGTAVARNVYNHNNENLFISYNSCNINRAIDRVGGFAPLQNAWIDNWATY